MKVVGIVGFKNSGKTTLVVELIAALRERGISVSSLKHTHHNVSVDRESDLSRRLRDAGAMEVLIANSQRHALLHEYQSKSDEDLNAVIAHLAPVDVVIVEGYKSRAHDKIEVHRVENGDPLLCHDDPHIRAVVSNRPLEGVEVPVLDRGDVGAIADFILDRFAGA